jgi:hypothetical protein
MTKSAHHRNQRHATISQKNAEPPEPDDSFTSPCLAKPSRTAAFCKQLLAYPLAFLLLIFACIYILIRPSDCRKKRDIMFREWPKLSLFKAYVQRLLRDIWRNSQPNRYAR